MHGWMDECVAGWIKVDQSALQSIKINMLQFTQMCQVTALKPNIDIELGEELHGGNVDRLPSV